MHIGSACCSALSRALLKNFYFPKKSVVGYSDYRLLHMKYLYEVLKKLCSVMFLTA